MRVLVLGATGRVGRLFVDEALRRGHAVTALVRTPDAGAPLPAAVSLVRGDALDADAVAAAVAGQKAVVFLLGAGSVRRTTLFSEATRALIAAMERQGVRRLLCVTGVGAGETKGHGGFLYDRVFFPLFTRGIYEDKDRQEALIRSSALDWTLVRPASFLRPPPNALVVATDVQGVVLRRIDVKEVALFLADELEQRRYVRQAVFIGHP